MKRVLICVAVCAAAAGAAVLWVVTELERFDAQFDKDAAYATFAEVEADGAVGRGWIRSFVPKTATDIRESHNVERGEIWLRFSAPAADIEALERTLRPMALADVSFPRERPTRLRPWWPVELIEGFDGQRARYRFFAFDANERRTFVAVEAETGRVWCWE